VPTGARPADALIVGGGVIGLATAWRAARAGLAVTVVDRSPGHGSTWAAAGMLAPVAEAHFGEEALVALNLEAAASWPAFARSLEAESGLRVDYVRSGSLIVAVDPSDRAAVNDLLAFQRGLGLRVEQLGARACRQAEPLLAPGIAGGVDVVDDHQVDNRLLVAALLAACRDLGVELVADEVAEVRPGSGVVLAGQGPRSAGTVVLAAGWQTGAIAGLSDADAVPVRPVKGMTLRLARRRGEAALTRTVRGLVHGVPCYLVPRPDGSLVVGATSEERGDDAGVRAGAVHDLLRDGRALVPSLDEYDLVETSVGFRPASPDNGPIIGPVADGLIVATGHTRNGILQAPLTAEAVLAHLEGRPPPASVAPFGPGRFDRRADR